MNRLVIISVIISGLFLGSCKTQQKATTSSPDDVYYQPSMAQDYAKPAPNSPQVVTSPDTTRAGNPASSTLAEDLNDYSYAARVKRFNNPTPGSGYYDDTYTNPANYDTTYQESSSPNVNVYVGAGFGAYGGSSMMFGFGTGYGYDPWGWGYSWGYPYYGYGYSPYYWYDPWYYPYPYWNSYGYGYWNGYYNGYYDGYYGYPYGGGGYYGWDYPYPTHYGRRTNPTGGGEGVGARPGTQQPSPATTLNPRTVPGSQTGASTNLTRGYTRTEPTGQITAVRTETKPNPVPATQQRYKYTRPSSEKQGSYQRQSTGYKRQNEQAAPRYVRPEQSQASPSTRSAGTTRNYSSPAYRQPKSSQEYLSPRTQAPETDRQGAQQGYKTNSTRTAQPAGVNRTTPSGTREYSSPQRGNTSPGRSVSPGSSHPSGTSSPQRSGSYTPSSRSSSGSSYSAPSRSGSSGGSYSSPSRSSGGSSGSSPRSGGGGGGRR